MKKRPTDFVRRRLPPILALTAVAAVIVLFLLSDVECPIKSFTGVSCAGCGMTRACLSAARLDFAAAFEYHPLWVALPLVAVLLVFFKVKKMNKSFYATIFIMAALMIAVYVYRLCFMDSDVVTWQPKSGKLYRLIKKIIS